MRKTALVCIATLVLSATAMASDIAISTQANWWSQTAADRETQEIVDNVKTVAVELFTAADHAALADWVIEHTGDGVSDLLMLCGQCPSTIYAPGNTQPDGSLVELFLDDGNCIINTGDWIFYMVDGAGTNGTAALPNIMDIPSMEMWDDDTPVTVTAEAQQYTPSLIDFATDRAIHLDALAGDWYAELILALAADGNRAEPVILCNSVTGGRIGVFFQTSTQDDDPRGEVISEWINNWYLPKFAGTNPLARRPDPKDGATVDATTVEAAWVAGDLAAMHDVYFGESYDEVSAATPDDAGVYVGRQTATQLSIGVAGGPAPDGLVPGKTYYWRVDAINEAEPDSPWTGKVWSFTVRPLTAWGPTPADRAAFVRLDQALSWNTGMGAVFHTVYFSESYDDVANATAEALQVADPTFLVETLEAGKTYYWRVDEFALDMTGIPANFEGEVWSFSTVPDIAIADPHLVGWWSFDEGSSDTAVDSSGYGHHGILNASVERVEGLFGGALHFGSGRVVDCGFDAASEVTGDFTLAAWVQLDRTNAGVYGGLGGKLQYLNSNYYGFGLVRHSSNFFRLWVGDGSTDLAKSAVSSNAPYTDTEWHHVAGVRNGQANTLYVDGVLQNATTNTGLAPSTDWFHIGRQYSTQTDRTFPGVIDDFRIYDTAATAATITQIMAGDENLASDPQPASGTVVDIRDVPDLLWSAGANAASHDVYFGTDRQAVAQADHEAAEFQGNQTDPSFSISDLATFGGGDYYWRIDEVEADGVTVRKGYVWKVTLPDYLPVDDFESYTDDEDAGTTIFQTWIDGLTNGTGSYVGYENASGDTFSEITVVRSGSQSMPLAYNNTETPHYSETERTWATAQDWTAEGVDTLSLFVRGSTTNGADPMYVGLQDSANKLGVVAISEAAITTKTTWTQLRIPLAAFGVKASAIKKMYIGIGDRDNPTPGGAGLIYIDDITVTK